MRTLAALLLLLLATPASAPPTLTIRQMYDSTLVLYTVEDGNIRRTCTVTLFSRDKDGYLGITAAHCLMFKGKKRELVKGPMFASLGRPPAENWMIDARPVVVGKPAMGYDIAIIRFPTKRDLPVVPLGDSGAVWLGQDLENVAAPLALGKFFFHGPVASLILDRPITDREKDINWGGAFAIDLLVLPGCSGSAVVAADQAAIVGVVVGTIGVGANAFGIVLPVSKLKDRTPGNWIMMPGEGLQPASGGP